MSELERRELSDLEGACLRELKTLEQALVTPIFSISPDRERYRLMHYQDVSAFAHGVLQGIYPQFQDSGTYIDSDTSKLGPALKLVADM